MGNIIIDIMQDNNLCTYELVFDEDRIKNIKRKLINYSKITEKEIRYASYYDTAESYCRKKNNFNHDEFLKELDHNFDEQDDIVISIAQFRNYPYLYKLLFEDINEDVFIKLELYMNNLKLDEHICESEKLVLVSEFLSSISFILVTMEKVEDIQNQMRVISEISARHNKEKNILLSHMNSRVKKSQITSKVIQSLYALTNNNNLLVLKFNNN